MGGTRSRESRESEEKAVEWGDYGHQSQSPRAKSRGDISRLGTVLDSARTDCELLILACTLAGRTSLPSSGSLGKINNRFILSEIPLGLERDEVEECTEQPSLSILRLRTQINRMGSAQDESCFCLNSRVLEVLPPVSLAGRASLAEFVSHARCRSRLLARPDFVGARQAPPSGGRST